MAKCKQCNATIPDGTQICKNCLDKDKGKNNESYLDSLLNSVKNSVPDVDNIYKKKNNNIKNNEDNSSAMASNIEKPQKTPSDDYEEYTVDMKDFEDFDSYFEETEFDDESVSDADLFGEDLSELLNKNISSDDNLKNANTAEEETSVKNSTAKSNTDENITDENISNINITDNGNTDEYLTDKINSDMPNTDNSLLHADFNEINDVNDDTLKDISDYKDNIDEADINKDIRDIIDDLDNNETQQTPLQNNNDGISNSESDLTKLNDTGKSDNNDYINNEEASDQHDTYELENDSNDEENQEADDDDFLNLLNEISSDDPVAEDAKAIGNMLNGKSAEINGKSDTPSDVGEVFSDALKVVSSLNDPDLDDIELLDKLPENNDVIDKKKQKKDKKKAKSKNKKSKQQLDGDDNKSTADIKEKPKKNIIKRIFGNVADKNADNIKAGAPKEWQEDTAAVKDKSKKGKQAKLKKGQNKKGQNPGVNTEDDLDIEDKQSVKDTGKNNKKAEKKEKKEKKKKDKEIIQVIDEIEEDEGRINRVGAGIVFIFFGLLVMLLLVGTNVVSYTLSIQHATDYFEKQKYNEAYNEVYGIDFKAEDMAVYDKIMTVMFVNKQLNSYNNYYFLGKYPEALDSLLKGLKRYDKYIKFATIIGIKTDLDYVREQILAELKNVFKISEKRAMKIISKDDMDEYSLEVYNVVLEKLNK